ncbi:MAG TPA: ATP-dependent sacrificial sulfur transferase LarE [Thermoplasmata archaeon]|nr:ATP-dependent sacrificial sulfur transferase LarE [Thermoplasmata archaeon]
MGTVLAPRSALRSADALVRRLAEGGGALVALSGGVDSSLVASLAWEALGRRSVAVTLAGPAVAPPEVARAGRVARSIGIEHVVLSVDPLSNAEYRANPPNRCYFCRSIETSVLRGEGERREVAQYLDGIQGDDLAVERPGLRAMDAAGFDHPLAWAGWGKAEVRRVARARGLENWDEPSDACLASRIAHGEPISRELLDRIAAGEAWIRARGFRRVRVRVSAGAARIEVDPFDVPRLTTEPLASQVVQAIEGLGFAPVRIDPLGYPVAARRPAAR